MSLAFQFVLLLISADDDFQMAPIEVTFDPTTDFSADMTTVVPIVDDDRNEAEKDFVVILEVLTASNPDQVDLSMTNTSIVHIRDNDRKLAINLLAIQVNIS